jgi:uncharacterized protein with HEPN domain
LRKFLEDIFRETENIISFTHGMSDAEDLIDNKMAGYACVRSLEVIGEAAKNISAETRRKHPEIEWQKIIGMRDVLSHGYFGVDWGVIWKTINEDVPELKESIKKLLG